MLREKFTFGLIAAAAAMALPGTAQAAVTVTAADIGDSFVIDFGGTNNSGTVAGLSGLLTVTMTSFGGSSAGFSYTLENDSAAPITASTLSGFGFNVDPTLTSASATGVFSNDNSGNIPNIGFVDICFSNSNSCSGGGGVLFGQTGVGTFTLNFGTQLTSIAFSDFAIRYQAISGVSGVSSWSGTGSDGNTNPPPPPVPEPATWMMMLLGFGLVGASMRHRKGIAFRAQFA